MNPMPPENSYEKYLHCGCRFADFNRPYHQTRAGQSRLTRHQSSMWISRFRLPDRQIHNPPPSAERKDVLMRGITTAISMMLLTLGAASAQGQFFNPAPPPELKKWNIWVGNWTLSGSAKDTPTGPEHKVDWSLHERWILGGF